MQNLKNTKMKYTVISNTLVEVTSSFKEEIRKIRGKHRRKAELVEKWQCNGCENTRNNFP